MPPLDTMSSPRTDEKQPLSEDMEMDHVTGSLHLSTAEGSIAAVSRVENNLVHAPPALRAGTLASPDGPTFSGGGARPSKVKSMNSFANQKTMANGLFDIALMTANASQLKLVMSSGDNQPHRAMLITCISISLILQIVTAILLLLLGRENFDKLADATRHDNKHKRRLFWKLNVTTTGLVFLIAIANVFIASFGLPGAAPLPVVAAGGENSSTQL